MYHIIICHKDLSFKKELSGLLQQMTQHLFMDCCITQCEETEQVKEIFTKKESVDLLFLGLELEDSLGFELGKYIREKLYDFDTPIVYISEKPEYAIELIDTMPFSFLSKPVSMEKLKSIMERFLKMQKKTKEFFRFKKGKTIKVISYDKIMYFQSVSPRLLVYTINGTTEFYGKLDDIEEQLSEHFIRIHKSYIVNTQFVIGTCYNSVTLLDKQKLPISRSCKMHIQDYLTKYLKER
ncbi:MAG: response regulator transcription factor [Clostridiales bacterium]|nr:response regulator transcription factor [Clostridiales bacterium]